MKVEQSIIIARPAAAVFAYRASLQQTAEWQSDVVDTELRTSPPTRSGTIGLERRRDAKGVVSDWEIEIIEFELNRSLALLGRCGATEIRERNVFATQDEMTLDQITKYTAFVEMTGSSVPAAAFHRRTIDGLMHFKWRLEEPDR